jgi:hypothetical protein
MHSIYRVLTVDLVAVMVMSACYAWLVMDQVYDESTPHTPRLYSRNVVYIANDLDRNASGNGKELSSLCSFRIAPQREKTLCEEKELSLLL